MGTHYFNKCAISKKIVKKSQKKVWRFKNWCYLCNNEKTINKMKRISTNYFQKWYNIVDDVLKDKAFNIIEEHRAQMLDSMEKTYKEGEDEDADMLVQALEDIYYCNFDITLSDEDAEKLDVLINFREYAIDHKFYTLDNYSELNDIYWDLQNELHNLMEWNIAHIIDLCNTNKEIADEVNSQLCYMWDLLLNTVTKSTNNTKKVLQGMFDEVDSLRFCCGDTFHYDADTFRFLDLLLNLPKHIADKDFRDDETLWQGWRDSKNDLERVIEEQYK